MSRQINNKRDRCEELEEVPKSFRVRYDDIEEEKERITLAQLGRDMLHKILGYVGDSTFHTEEGTCVSLVPVVSKEWRSFYDQPSLKKERDNYKMSVNLMRDTTTFPVMILLRLMMEGKLSYLDIDLGLEKQTFSLGDLSFLEDSPTEETNLVVSFHDRDGFVVKVSPGNGKTFRELTQDKWELFRIGDITGRDHHYKVPTPVFLSAICKSNKETMGVCARVDINWWMGLFIRSCHKNRHLPPNYVPLGEEDKEFARWWIHLADYSTSLGSDHPYLFTGKFVEGDWETKMGCEYYSEICMCLKHPMGPMTHSLYETARLATAPLGKYLI